MPRRPRNPSGFVRKHPDTSSVRWQGIVKYPDPDKPGAWKQRSATFDRKAEAQAWVDATLAEHRAKPDYRPPSEETFGDYMERWLRDVAALHVRASSLQSHRYMAKHAIGAFGHKPLADVRPADMQKLYASLIASGRATTTVRYVHAVTRKALQDAVEMGLLSSNPVDRAKRPRVVKKEIVPPNMAQAQAFLRHVDDDRTLKPAPRAGFNVCWPAQVVGAGNPREPYPDLTPEIRRLAQSLQAEVPGSMFQIAWGDEVEGVLPYPADIWNLYSMFAAFWANSGSTWAWVSGRSRRWRRR